MPHQPQATRSACRFGSASTTRSVGAYIMRSNGSTPYGSVPAGIRLSPSPLASSGHSAPSDLWPRGTVRRLPRLSRDEGETTVTPELAGTWFVLPTPFAEDSSVDLPSQRIMVKAAIQWGVDGLTTMGVTSEASALTPAERTPCLKEIFEAAAG